jgi:DsbC/DsbD-like thiol-disulfide interchange protein
MRKIIALLPLLLLPTPVIASATPWQDVAPGVRLRMISNDVKAADGATLVGLELDMTQAFKTYWRLPGESGIATELDIAGSSGLSGATIQWPFPTPETSNGFLDYVYRGPTVLPVSLKVTGTSPQLQAAVTMGVCSDICVPVRASFALPLPLGTPDVAEDIRLRQALALSPISWTRDAAPFEGVTYDAKARALRVAAIDASIDPGSVIATTSDPTIVFDTPQKSPDGRSILLPLRGANVTTGWAARPIQLTFMTAMGSFEVSERVTVDAP